MGFVRDCSRAGTPVVQRLPELGSFHGANALTWLLCCSSTRIRFSRTERSPPPLSTLPVSWKPADVLAGDRAANITGLDIVIGGGLVSTMQGTYLPDRSHL